MVSEPLSTQNPPPATSDEHRRPDSANFLLARLPHDLRRKLIKRLYPRYYWSLLSYRGKLRSDGYGLLPLEHHDCIFIHIPKCAGVSVSKSLFGTLAASHLSLREYQIVYSRAQYSRFYKFTFARHPMDRLLSAYRFLKKGGFSEIESRLVGPLLAPFSTFKEFVLALATDKALQRWIHFRPQIEFLQDFSGAIDIDFIGRFETLAEDFGKIAAQLGMTASLQKLNSTGTKKDYAANYDDEMVAVVSRLYADDFRVLGYSY